MVYIYCSIFRHTYVWLWKPSRRGQNLSSSVFILLPPMAMGLPLCPVSLDPIIKTIDQHHHHHHNYQHHHHHHHRYYLGNHQILQNIFWFQEIKWRLRWRQDIRKYKNHFGEEKTSLSISYAEASFFLLQNVSHTLALLDILVIKFLSMILSLVQRNKKQRRWRWWRQEMLRLVPPREPSFRSNWQVS